MYYSLSFSYNKPTEPMHFRKDDILYPANLDVKRPNKNTAIDWFLVPTERPSFEPPEVITKTVEIPGMGDLDLTESLTGYPAYKNRTGSIEFLILNDNMDWHDIYQDMCSYLHGRKLYVSYEEDPAFFYYGRFKVSAYESGDNNSHITIEYDLEPYKYEYNKGYLEGGYWDILDFETDFIDGVKYTDKFYQIPIDSNDYVTICDDEDWGNYTECPILPEFTISPDNMQSITIHFTSEELGIDVTKTFNNSYKGVIGEIVFDQINNVGKYRNAGIKSVPTEPLEVEYVRKANTIMDIYVAYRTKLEIKGHGTVTINCNPGRK